MKVGAENKRQTIIASVAGAVALLLVIYEYNALFGGPDTPPPARPAVIASAPAPKTTVIQTKGASAPPGFAAGVSSEAAKIATINGQLDPTLHPEAMLLTESLVYSGNGRNIFGLGPAVVETKIEAPKAPARPIQQVAYVPPPAPTGPPPPPPIELKFFGTATAANGNRRAFLLHGEDVFLASAGDIVQRRYKVVTIAANSIVIEDMPNNNKQTLPLQAN